MKYQQNITYCYRDGSSVFNSKEENIHMQIPEEMKECVIFVAMRTGAEAYQLIGTAFKVMTHSDRQPELGFGYIVTAKHVWIGAKQSAANHDGKLYLRINTPEGKYKYIATEFRDWRTHPDIQQSVDLIAMPLPYVGELKNSKIQTIDIDMFLTQEIIEKENISIGEIIFMIGLFSNFAGKAKNIPIVRCGNLAAMPDEPIKTKSFANLEAYLIELHSLGGLSGSPVFLYLEGVRRSKDAKRVQLIAGQRFYFLGVLHGHWNLQDALTDTIELDSFANPSSINTGIGIVTPAQKLYELLTLEPSFKETEKNVIDGYQNAVLPELD